MSSPPSPWPIDPGPGFLKGRGIVPDRLQAPTFAEMEQERDRVTSTLGDAPTLDDIERAPRTSGLPPLVGEEAMIALSQGVARGAFDAARELLDQGGGTPEPRRPGAGPQISGTTLLLIVGGLALAFSSAR